MTAPKSAASDAYTKFLMSKVNETITQRDIFNAGVAAGRESAGKLVKALTEINQWVDKDKCTQAFETDCAPCNIGEIATAALTRFKALAGVENV